MLSHIILPVPSVIIARGKDSRPKGQNRQKRHHQSLTLSDTGPPIVATLAQDSSMPTPGSYSIIMSSVHSSGLHFLHVHSRLSRPLSKAIHILMYALV